MSRVAIGGWQHETNTFATVRADYQAFAEADEWPAMHSGQQMLDSVRDIHLPIAGAFKALDERGHEIVPLLWCSATPSSYVTEDAFEQIASKILCLIEQAMPVDGIYLDLHGAMVCEHLEDGEGEFLSRVRNLVGDNLPVFVSLDLHANITPLMVEKATVIDVYRTYPHIDMGETGYRVTEMICNYLRNPCNLFKAYRQVNFLIPLNSGCTLIEPCRTIYQKLPGYITAKVASLSFACGFHLSDIYDAGPAIVAYGYDQRSVDVAVQAMSDVITQYHEAFYQKIWPVDAGIAEARRVQADTGGTVVIADTQDNPGGGGAGDTIGVLRAMLNQNLTSAVFGVVNDAVVARMAHEAGVGVELDVELGGRVSTAGKHTLACRVKVLALSNGMFTAKGPMYQGARMEIGDTALLQIQDVLVVVCSKAVQTADQMHFRHIGVAPGKLNFVAIKSSVHFRNDFEKLASNIFIVAAPGEVYADPASLQYRNLRPHIEITSLS